MEKMYQDNINGEEEEEDSPICYFKLENVLIHQSKIIENIASTNSHGIQKFLSNQSDVVNAIWSCYSHSGNNDQLRIASLKVFN